MLELRVTVRHLRRNPTHVAAVVLSLGIGMAVCVAVFSFVNAVVFSTIPGIEDRRSLVRVTWSNQRGLFTPDEFQVIDAQNSSAFTGLAAQGDSSLPVVLPNGPATLQAGFVSSRFFETLGTRAVAGRLLDGRDAPAGAAPVVVLSEALWRGAFNADASIFGQTLTIGARPFTIVGVAPASAPGLRILDVGSNEAEYPQLWLALHEAVFWNTTSSTRTPWLSLAGRLSSGVSLRAARAEVALLQSRLPPQPRLRDRAFLRASRAGLDWRDDPWDSLLTAALFLFVPLTVLSIACLNVINLQFARAMEQAGQLSLRLALGASRGQIVRLLSIEMAFLSLASGLVGWVGARVALDRAQALVPTPLTIDRRVLTFAAVLVVMVVGAAGVLPAWVVTRDVVATGLRSLQDGTRLRTRMRGVLVCLQVATSVVLLGLSGLAIRAVIARSPALPHDPGRILVTEINLINTRPVEPRPGLFVTAVLDRLREEPTITDAAFSTFLAFGSPIQLWRSSDAPNAPHVAFGGFVTASWFDLMDTKFLAGGRPQHLAATTTDAVVNASLAAALGHPDASILGTSLSVNHPAGTSLQGLNIVGLVANSILSPDGEPVPMVFLPMPEHAFSSLVLTARTRDLTSAHQSVRTAVSAADAMVPLGRVDSLDVRVGEMFKGFRETAWFALTLGLVSLILAAAGLFSLLAYTVRRRTREIGIRLALGAQRQHVVLLVLRQGLALVLLGAVVGLLVAAPLAGLLRSVLFGASPLSLSALLPTLGVLLGATVVSSLVPAYRASRVDPVEALRDE